MAFYVVFIVVIICDCEHRLCPGCLVPSCRAATQTTASPAPAVSGRSLASFDSSGGWSAASSAAAAESAPYLSRLSGSDTLHPINRSAKILKIYYWVTGRVLICTKNCSSCLLFLLYILYWFALKRRIYFRCFTVNLMKPHTHSCIKCEFEVNFVSIIKVSWNWKVMTGL